MAAVSAVETHADGLDGASRLFRVKPGRPGFATEIAEVWAYRELLFFLIWRDIKLRYKQTVLGSLWAILQPLIAMVIFTIIFHRFAGIQADYGVPYPLFAFTGLLPWLYFAACLSQSSTSIVGNAALVTKVFFPRLIIPLASVVGPLMDFFLAFAVLVGMFLWYGRIPHWHLIVTPFFLALALLTALGVGLWLSALNVRYRDVPYVIPFMTQVWFFATPVVYGLEKVSLKWRSVMALNPMTGVVDGFRWAVLGRGLPHYHVWGISAVIATLITLSGLWYFKRVERHFADVI
jgi:lipopolysaccharide transport system permease protein